MIGQRVIVSSNRVVESPATIIHYDGATHRFWVRLDDPITINGKRTDKLRVNFSNVMPLEKFAAIKATRTGRFQGTKCNISQRTKEIKQ